MEAVKTLKTCPHCGGNLVPEYDDIFGWEWKCLNCGREPHRDWGRMGGLQTKLRHPPDYYSKIGKLGGRPRSKTLSGLRPSPRAQSRKGVKLPNSYRGLRRLYAIRKEGELLTV